MNFVTKTLLSCGLFAICGESAALVVQSTPASPRIDSSSVRPAYVNNAESRYFPPVFNQDGGSCGSASRIGYMFTHEINAFRGADASKPENIYPTHFTWLLTNSHSGKEGMAMANGVPNAVVYGGTTYSKVFGNQDCAHPDFGWMQGYDKWYSAMFNRISHNSFSPHGVDTEEGREYVKNWLWNHHGDPDFHTGGICGIGVASACGQAPVPDDPEGRNKAAGLAGMKYVTHWGNGVDHALTIVGYDDRVVFDLDDNHVFGEPDKDERGAWIIVNSWGNGWANKGFIYCPYKYGFPVRKQEGGAWKPEFYHVRKNYRPLRTLKVRMAHSRRSELKLSVGVSADLSAAEPEATVELEHFKFAGDGRSDKAKLAGLEARTPMLGKWADGKLHDEPMEFGYDLTDLSAGFDTRRPLKYFFIIESKGDAIGAGRIYDCAVLDYEFDRAGIETPLKSERSLPIANHGRRTVVSAVVAGEPFFAPANVRYSSAGGAAHLTWEQPQSSRYRLSGYVLYKNGVPADTLPPARLTHTFTGKPADYAVAAVYDHPYASADTAFALSARRTAVCTDAPRPAAPAALNLEGGGFVVPGVFAAKQPRATIEYWLTPRSWRSWNQCVGPGWGNFLIHANDNGSLTFGWDGDNRFDTPPGLITPGRRYHFAFVVSADTLTAYVDGRAVGTLVSRSRSGIGGFGDLAFSTSREGALDGEISHVRVWKEARTAAQIRETMHADFAAAGMPSTLMAYYKGEQIEVGGKRLLRDFAAGRHARFAAFGRREAVPAESPKLLAAAPQVDFACPEAPVYAGCAVTLQAECSPVIETVAWDAPDAGIKGLKLKTPELIFDKPGRHLVKLTGTTPDGRSVHAEKAIDVRPRRLNARFAPAHSQVAAGERISFHPANPLPGFKYEWTLPGGDVEEARTQAAAATYYSAGDYKVKLRVTDPLSGRSQTESIKLHVKNVAPESRFELSPMAVLKGEEIALTDRSRYAPTSWKWQLDSRRYTLFADGRNPKLRLDVPGVYDITLTAANEVGTNAVTQKQALIVCNADSKNGLNFSNPSARLAIERPLWDEATDEMTIDWWMLPSGAERQAGMGCSAATWQLFADARGNMTFHADSLSVQSGGGYVIPGAWHHYAVTFRAGEVEFLRDGEVVKTDRLASKKRSVTALPAAPSVSLGGEAQPMNAVIDEFRVWRKALPATTLQQFCNAPLANVAAAESAHNLLLYYAFNQSGGHVADLTSRQHIGRREHFGPDGDAWGKSTGVFSLNFDTPLINLTDSLLPPAESPFATLEQTVNPQDAKRFRAFKANARPEGWHVENSVTNDSVTTGIYVDRNKGDALCVFTEWDKFANRLANHKLYSTVQLPAGKYELEVVPHGGMSAGASVLVAAPGKGLPNADGLSSAIATAPLSERRLSFILPEAAEVSLGIVFNLQGRSGVAINRIVLRRAAVAQQP